MNYTLGYKFKKMFGNGFVDINFTACLFIGIGIWYSSTVITSVCKKERRFNIAIPFFVVSIMW